MGWLLWNRARDALDEVAGRTDVVVVVGFAGALVALFAVVRVGFCDESAFFEVLKVPVDGCEVDVGKFSVKLGSRPGPVFEEEVEKLVAVGGASQAGRL